MRLLIFHMLVGLAIPVVAQPVSPPLGEGTAPSPITALAITPDGTGVVLGSQAGVFVHPLAITENSRGAADDRRLLGVNGAVHALAFSSDGKSLAVVGGDPAETARVVILTWPDADRSRVMEFGSDVGFDARWQQRELVVASLDGQCRVLDETGHVRREFAGHSRGVTSCRLIGDRLLVTGSLDATLRVWGLADGRLLRTLNQHAGPVLALATRPARAGPTLMASVSADRTVRFWQPEIGRMVRFARLPAVPLAADWVDPTTLAVACRDGTVRVIDYETVTIADERPVAECPLHSLVVDRGRILVGRADGRLSVLALP